MPEQVLPKIYLVVSAIYDKNAEFNAITGSDFKSFNNSDRQGLNVSLFCCISCGKCGVTGISQRVDSYFIVADPLLNGEGEKGGLELWVYLVLPFSSADGERENSEGLELFFDCGVNKGKNFV